VPCNLTLTAAYLDAAGATVALGGEARAGCTSTSLAVTVLDGAPVSARKVEIDVAGYVFAVYVVRTGARVRLALLVRRPGFETTDDPRGVELVVLGLSG
jgi:hypothetical protein